MIDTSQTIFEIPVYALSRKELAEKYARFRQDLLGEDERNLSGHQDVVMYVKTYPFRMWDYNHIIGYIRISTNGRDIQFNVFLPTPHRSRYRWRSRRKIFLHNICANGIHFYVHDKMSSKDIRTRTAEMLGYVIETYIPRRFFVDIEAFNLLNANLDYISIMRESTLSNDFEFEDL